MEIKYYTRENNEPLIEKVYGEKSVEFLYDSLLGRSLWPLITRPLLSKIYGALQTSDAFSRRKIKPFIKNFQIDMSDYEYGEGGSKEQPYRNFNEFFIRKFKPGKRPFVQEAHLMPAFSEARYLAWEKIEENQTYPVKGKYLSAKNIVNDDKWYKYFEGGPLMIARLCPTDYHRYHYPDNGKVLDMYGVKGPLHSVNPIAFKYKEDILCTNERVVSILETENFGKLAYVEVGATMVGKIIQSHDSTKPFARGEEKGYFLFGGSTVILLGEPGKWRPSKDLLENTSNQAETWLKIGDQCAEIY